MPRSGSGAATSARGNRRSGNPAKRGTVQPGRPQQTSVGARDWIGGARIRTLPLALAPVALGSAVAYLFREFDLTLALLCLGVAIFLQIGVNFANDYSDGVRGTDRFRVGPSRLTGSGLVPPRRVLATALVFFALAAVCGLAIVVLTQHWWLLAIGVLALVAAWFYTGGRRPYGYAGFGELVSAVFFGPVATAGTAFVMLNEVPLEAWLAGFAVAFFTAAVMLVNNVRDREQDALAGKRTLAVRIGDRPARILFAVLVLAPFVVLGFFALLYRWAPLVYLTLLSGIPAAVIGLFGTTPRELILALKLTSLTVLLFSLGLAAAIAF